MINIQPIFDAGYRVFMRPGSDNYCFYTDGVRIALAEWEDSGYFLVSVHVPSPYVGRGYLFKKNLTSLTKEDLEGALNLTRPSWAMSEEIRKFRDWSEFSLDRWNARLVEITNKEYHHERI